jgi:hypothetical protein
VSSLAAARSPAPRFTVRRVAAERAGGGLALGALVAAGIVALALGAQGGTALGRQTWADVGVTLVGTGLVAAAILLAPSARRAWGGLTLAAFGLLAVWTALSIAWAVFGEDAWLEANRTLSYLAIFAGGAALARLAPQRWAALVGGIAAGATLVALYALATKVFPGSVGSDELFGRLRAPFGYWNAIGLMAALGVPPMLWLGARRDGHGALGALAFPATGLLLVAVLLSYSRGSLLALGIGLLVWFAFVPLRLRAVAVLAPAVAAAVLVALWAFARPALSDDFVASSARRVAGHQLGMLLAALVVVLFAIGVAVRFAAAHGSLGLHARRRAGAVILALLVLAGIGGLVVLQTRDGGITGQVSHAWNTFTDPDAAIPGNDPSRLTASGSVRARYWDEALQVWRAHRWKGVGAGGFATARQRISRDQLRVRHAHGYAVQTLADLGIVGLALSVLVTAAWVWAALRTVPPRIRGPASPERAGALTLLAVTVVFGVHSLVDWTWFIPADAVIGMLAAGWLAGRGPLEEPARPRTGRPGRWRAGAAAGVAVLGLVVVWAMLGPLRSQWARDDSEAALAAGDPAKAAAAAETASSRDPLSPEPLYDLAAARQAAGDLNAAHDELRRAVRLAPRSSDPWIHLGEFELDTLGDPAAAQHSLAAALRLDPHSPEAQDDFLRAREAVASGS